MQGWEPVSLIIHETRDANLLNKIVGQTKTNENCWKYQLG